jgi:hypothetical protein
MAFRDSFEEQGGGGISQADADTRYVNETDHTKAAHDALLLDAATLDGIDSTGFAPASHVNSRDGHPLATDTLDGFMAGVDKAKLDAIESGKAQRLAPSPAYTAYDLTLAASTWTRMSPSAGVYEPHMDFPILGAAPTGTNWRYDVTGFLKITTPGATTLQLGVGVGGAWTMGGAQGGLYVSSGVSALIPISAVGFSVPDPTVAFTLTMAVWADLAGTYRITSLPRPTAKAYLVKT